MVDYEKQKRRLEKEIEVLRLKKRLVEREVGRFRRGSGILGWVILIAVIIFLLYTFGLIDVPRFAG